MPPPTLLLYSSGFQSSSCAPCAQVEPQGWVLRLPQTCHQLVPQTLTSPPQDHPGRANPLEVDRAAPQGTAHEKDGVYDCQR